MSQRIFVKKSVFIFVLFFSYLLSGPIFAHADDSIMETPSISRDEKMTVTTEHVDSEEKEDEIIDTYKTTIIQEIEVTVDQLETISSSENIKAKKPRTYRSRIVQELETIIVTAKRIFSKVQQTAENVIVYSEEEIKKLPARDLGEVLSYIPGVDIESRNKFGQATSLSINGSNSTEVLLLVDGIPFNTELSGQANPTKIPVEIIKQIEIIKGASSSAWGSSLGGVVHVKTKDAGTTIKPTGNFQTTFAEFATTKNSLDLAGTIGKLGYYVFGSFMNTDGIRSDSRVEELKYFGKLAYPLNKEIKIESSFGYTGAEVHDGIKPNGSTLFQPNYTHYGQVSLSIDKSRSHFYVASKYNIQDLQSETVGGSVINSKSNYQGLSLIGSHTFRDKDLLVAGVDFDFNTVQSSSNIEQPKTNSVQAPYMNYTLNLDKLDVIPGFRYDHHNRFGSQVSPSLGAVYRFEDAKDTKLRAKVSQAFNAPHLLLIYAESLPLVVPNAALQPETAVVYEVGMATNVTPKFKMDLNGYWAEIKDAIEVVDIGTFEFQPQNFKKFRRQSIDLRLDYDISDDLAVFAYGAFNHVVDEDASQIVRGTGIPRQSFRLGMNYKNDKGFGFNLYGYYDRSNNNASAQPNDRKFIFDAKFSHQLIHHPKDDDHDAIDLELFLNIYNIGNSKYWANINFPLPKRYFEGGFSIKF